MCHFYNDARVEATESTCILLNLYPRKAPPQLCMIFNQIVDFIDTDWGHIFQNLNQDWLSRHYLKTFSGSIYRKGAALDNVWGFL